MSPQQHADKIDQLTEELNKAVLAARNDDLRVDVSAGGHPLWAIVQSEVATRHHPARVLRQLHAKRVADDIMQCDSPSAQASNSPRDR